MEDQSPGSLETRMTIVFQPLAVSGLCLLVSVLHVPVTEAAISVGAAAASGVMYAAGGPGGGRNPYRDENAEASDLKFLFLSLAKMKVYVVSLSSFL